MKRPEEPAYRILNQTSISKTFPAAITPRENVFTCRNTSYTSLDETCKERKVKRRSKAFMFIMNSSSFILNDIVAWRLKVGL
jgi:hypothetical protein